MGGTRLFVSGVVTPGCVSTPFLWSCPKKRGGAPKKNAFGRLLPHKVVRPPASPTLPLAPTRPLRCPLRGLISSLAPRARGWEKVKTPQRGVFYCNLRDVEAAAPYNLATRVRGVICRVVEGGGTASQKRTTRARRRGRRPRRPARTTSARQN